MGYRQDSWIGEGAGRGEGRRDDPPVRFGRTQRSACLFVSLHIDCVQRRPDGLQSLIARRCGRLLPDRPSRQRRSLLGNRRHDDRLGVLAGGLVRVGSHAHGGGNGSSKTVARRLQRRHPGNEPAHPARYGRVEGRHLRVDDMRGDKAGGYAPRGRSSIAQETVHPPISHTRACRIPPFVSPHSNQSTTPQ